MTDTEQKAMEMLRKDLERAYNKKTLFVETTYNALDISLNLIQKQDTEINKLNNVIDRMAEVIEECRQNDCIETTDDLDMSEIAGVEKIKEYFMKDDK